MAVVFAQLAVSAFACPMLTGVVGGQAEVVDDIVDSVASSADAAPMSQPALCHKHCANDQQGVNDLPSPLASVAFAPAFVVTLPIMPAMTITAITLSPPLLHATSPPLSIRHCCFRI